MTATVCNAAGVAAACRENAAAVAESLNLGLDTRVSLTPGEPVPWILAPEALSGPGLLVRLGTSEGGLLGLIPATLPLPNWYAAPDEFQQVKLGNFATEWSVLLLPAHVLAEIAEAAAVPDLLAAAETCRPHDSAELIPLLAEDGSPAIYLLAPVAQPASETAAPVASANAPERPAPATPAPAPPPAAPAPNAASPKLKRLLPVPVQVVVRLAEKKIEMGQLLALAPGTLITFNKNCEDLLDLYINNRLYCRGEAVKIGENFGLKVNEVGTTRKREERVF
jgi:flagellar motor switch protein FliN/FliY